MRRSLTMLVLMAALPIQAAEVIFPFLQPQSPKPGAHGSMWMTRLTVFNDGSDTELIGLDCGAICGPTIAVAPGQVKVLPYGGPGFRLTGDQATLLYRLRAFDVSRLSSSLGVEIPVLRENDFAEVVQLVDIPVREDYRTSLRVYSFRGVPVGQETVPVRVSVFDESGSLWKEEEFALIWFSPTPYLELHSIERDLLAEAPDIVRIQIESILDDDAHGGFPIYAFATTTNNTSQEVTLTTPAR